LGAVFIDAASLGAGFIRCWPRLEFEQAALRGTDIEPGQGQGVAVTGLFALAERGLRVAADLQRAGMVGLGQQGQGLLRLAGIHQQPCQAHLHDAGQRRIGRPGRVQGGDRGIALLRLHLRLGQLQ
jgi:hypothetical protein